MAESKMAAETRLLSMCISMTMELTKMQGNVKINIDVGPRFHFDFSNMGDESFTGTKRISPSKLKRNETRRLLYAQRKFGVEEFNLDGCTFNHNVTSADKESQCDELKETSESVMQTETIYDSIKMDSLTDKDTQTDYEKTFDIGVNTELGYFDKLENTLRVNSDGEIRAEIGEAVIEMQISHEFKNWDEIQKYVKSSLKMRLCGRPWLANNGRLYKTVEFRTLKEDYENWKIETFNWQSAGIREVSSSRLLK